MVDSTIVGALEFAQLQGGYDLTAADTHKEPRAEWISAALRGVALAGNWLTAAKRTRSVVVIESAQRDLQNAVDAARDLDIEWGPIGSALGIARGNAYQRYRRKPPGRSLREARDASGNYRFPPL
jgi:hypothetical protein